MTVHDLISMLTVLPQDDEVRIAVPSTLHSCAAGTRSQFVVASLRPEYQAGLGGHFWCEPDHLGDLVDPDGPDGAYLTIVPPETNIMDAPV